MYKNIFSEQGNFLIGINYWASHSGTGMWRNWRSDIVEQDLRQLKETGIKYLRVFPLWPDFQPLKLYRMCEGVTAEYRYSDELALTCDNIGKAGMSHEMLCRFDDFLQLASKFDLKIIVGLITGWMSGRLFVPTALEGKDILSDPVSLMWQVRFVKCFVQRFKSHNGIIAWELGNECNCMQNVSTSEAAWQWISSLTHAIRSVDGERPVLSGMHGLKPQGIWNISDQSELLDVLTTHTYPVFTEYCDLDPFNTIRAVLHSTVQTRYFSDISGKPCFVEEFGTLGPMFASDKIAADFIRVCMFSLFAHDCRGLFWWCAYDQSKLHFPPYEWNACECELGMFDCDRIPKPVAGEIERFSCFIGGLPVKKLPDRIKEAVCILTSNQDQWGVSYSSFILAKQAGFDIEFQYHDQPLKEAPLYLLPCIEGTDMIKQKTLDGVLQKVFDGAVLYISNSNGHLRNFNKITGLEIQTYERRIGPEKVTLDICTEEVVLSLNSDIKLALKAKGATIIGVESDGNPAFSVFEYGKGRIYFLAFPMEMQFVRSPGAFFRPQNGLPWKVYEFISMNITQDRCVRKTCPEIGITEHPINENERVVVIINYSPISLEFPLTLKSGWIVDETYYGNLQKESISGCMRLSVRQNDACMLRIIKG